MNALRCSIALVVTAAIAGCSSGTADRSTPLALTPPVARPASSMRGYLYVENCGCPKGVKPRPTITVYSPGSRTPAISIPAVGAGPMAFDATGNFYVLFPSTGTVNVYAQGSGVPSRTITLPVADSNIFAVDAAGDVAAPAAAYASGSQSQNIDVFGSGSTTPSRTLSVGGSITNLAFDPEGNLYAGFISVPGFFEQSAIARFTPDALTPTTTASVEGGIGSLGFDLEDNLYVLTAVIDPVLGGIYSSINIYAPGGYSPIETITENMLDGGSVLAAEPSRSGTLYVSVGTKPGSAAVLVFAPGANAAKSLLPNGGAGTAIAFDGKDIAYVAYTKSPKGSGNGHTRGDVVLYAPNRLTPRERITAGIDSPTAIAISP